MSIDVLCILALLATICITFLVLKRPIYECMFFGYVVMLLMNGKTVDFFTYIFKTSTDTLFYSIIAFLVMAKILDATKAIDGVVAIVVSLFGRVRGGAGYAAIIASTFMGALSGSGAGNVATTGVFTIPSMIKSGFPRHLAANVESAASAMGNMIPPSGVILAALACYNEVSGAEMSQSTFWIVVWGIAIWFIVQRFVTLYAFCRIYNVKPMNKEDLPDVKETLKKGWKNLLLPIIILGPFIVDYFFKSTFFADRLGEGAANFSSSLLLFTPGLAAVYAIVVNKKELEGKNLFVTIKDSVEGIVPIGATIFFSYCISNLFADTSIGENVGNLIKGWNMPLWLLCLIIPLITAILGMVLPGSAQTKIFGGTIVSIVACAGGNPLLVAAMLPAITGAMEGMTPPLALCMYTAMGIAKADIKSTTINCLFWILGHYIVSVLCLMGLLPILGL